MERTIRHTVGPQEEGLPLLAILKGPLGFSSAAIRRMKLAGSIRLNGAAAYTTARVHAGDAVCCTLPPEAQSSPHIQPVPGPLCIRYEDQDLLILDKPAGTPVHPSQGHFTDSLANYLAYEMAQRGTPFVFRAVNRLDRNTSGLMAVAKNSHAHSRLAQALHTGALHREYRALVCGAIRPACGVIDAPILDVPGRLERLVSPAGSRAVTHYETLEEGGPYALVRLWLETGRTHQIRVHLAHIGHPLAGDFLYGTELPGLLVGHALHSSLLRLEQPVTGRIIQVESPIRPQMARLLAGCASCPPPKSAKKA